MNRAARRRGPGHAWLPVYRAGCAGARFSITHGGNAEWFMKFGTASPVTAYGRHILGDDLEVPYDEAQDGARPSGWSPATRS